MTAAKAKIFIVDDHPLVREWLANLIHQTQDLVVCGEAEDHALIPCSLGVELVLAPLA